MNNETLQQQIEEMKSRLDEIEAELDEQEKVYMTEECAIEICEMLNNGEFEL